MLREFSELSIYEVTERTDPKLALYRRPGQSTLSHETICLQICFEPAQTIICVKSQGGYFN